MEDIGRYYNRMHRYCLRLAGNRQDAEELAQEAMLRLVQALRSDPSRRVANAYLYRIASNARLDRLKKRIDPLLPDGEPPDAGSADDRFMTRELLETLAHRLSPRSLVTLLLVDVFDFTARETALLIDSTDGAVQVALGRARRRLRRLAADPDADGSAGGTDETEPAVDLDALVEAFRRRDPRAIARVYLGLVRRRCFVTAIRLVDGRLSFTVTDPDGNTIRVTS